jgi:hypothetical protein
VMPRSADAETFVGSNVDSRVLIGVGAKASAVQSMMPEGWTSVPFPGGPLKGANFLIVLIDRKVGLDPEGKPMSPSSLRAVAYAGLGKQNEGDAVRLYLFRIHTTNPDSDPYGVAVAAQIERAFALSGAANGERDVNDEWSVALDGGGEMNFAVSFKTGNRSFAPGEAVPYSAENPEFSRIYRYDQVVDLVMSEPIGKSISGDFKLTSSVPEFSAIFDGT